MTSKTKNKQEESTRPPYRPEESTTHLEAKADTGQSTPSETDVSQTIERDDVAEPTVRQPQNARIAREEIK